MTVTAKTIEQNNLPALRPAEEAAMLAALEIPDVSALDITRMSAENLATLSKSLRSQLATVEARVSELKKPVTEMADAADAIVKKTILDNKGTMLPHPTFDVVITRTPGQRNAKDARFAGGLFDLFDLVPADQLAPCMWIDSIDPAKAGPEAVSAVIAAGAKASWKCDLRKLDSLAKKFGKESAIAKIIAEATPRGEPGEWILSITPRESALKAAS